MGTDPTVGMTESELADYYDRARDVSDFDDGAEQPIKVARNVTISVRFSEAELEELRARADAAGLKVTAFIRASALDAARPVDRDAVLRLAEAVEDRAHELRRAIG